MPTLPNMSIITPTLGGDSGQWDDKINAGFGLVDAHDHSSGKGVTVKTAGLEINADLTIAGYALTNVGKTAFTAVAALASGSKTLFVSSANNELYWRSNAGTNVQLTSGSSINTSLVGGIGGDYSTVGADLDYSDAAKTYTHKIETGTWARVASGPVRIYEYNTSESVYVEHAIDAALASSYTVTWPAAVPASTAIVQITSAGVVSFSNTIVNHLVMTVDKNITLSGTGDVSHGARTKVISLHPMAVTAGSAAFGTDAGGEIGSVYAVNTVGYIPLSEHFRTNDILSEVLFLNNNTGGGTHAYSVVSIDTSGAETVRETTSSATDGSVTLTLDPVVSPSTTSILYLKIATGVGNSTHMYARVTYTH